MNNKSFLIVSQDGTPVRQVRINFLTVVLPVVFIAAGAAAYFIPSDMFRLKDADQQQKKELRAQNKLLHERFFSTLKVLNRAKDQVIGIETKKEKLAALTGRTAVKDPSNRSEGPQKQSEDDFSYVKPAAWYDHLCARDSVVSAFAARMPPGKNPFEFLPVCKPVQANAVVSRCFGLSLDPFTGLKKQHNGADFAAPAGTPVIAAASGYIARVEASEFWGKRVVIEHGNGISTVYAHLGSIGVRTGRAVKRGAVIGTVGVSGVTSGPHLHYEVWKNGTALDPEELFFPAHGK
jgi:murein DD-endopeptidase MepM/ murein hydrolase activator NlpD